MAIAILLKPEVEGRIEALVSRGVFESVDQFLDESVRAAEAREKRAAELQASLEEGMRDLAEGRYQQFDDAGLIAFGEQIKREGRRAAGQPEIDVK